MISVKGLRISDGSKRTFTNLDAGIFIVVHDLGETQNSTDHSVCKLLFERGFKCFGFEIMGLIQCCVFDMV